VQRAVALGAGDVDVLPPAQTLVEALGAVDVGDRHDHDLELEVDGPGLGNLNLGLVAHSMVLIVSSVEGCG
jgi:hypothetical protein